MAEVRNIRSAEELEKVGRAIRGLEPPGGPPHNGDMEQRIAKLEAIIPTLATKEDLARTEGALRAEIHKSINEQTWKLITWMSTIALALVSATYFIATHVT
jgi:hypothetical protein